MKQPHSKLLFFAKLVSTYGVVVVSVGLEGMLVVSTGILVAVSSPIPDGALIAVSLVVSDPVEFCGVSQPMVANARKAMKRMLFMRNTFS